MSTIGDISYRTKWILSKRYIQAIIVIALMTLAIAIPFLTRAFALTDVGNAGVFELDGNIVRNTAAADWGDGPGGMGLFDSSGNTQSLPAGGLDAHWVNDGPHAVTDLTTFTTGSKDTLDIANAGWQCTPSGNLTPKDDILHAYSFAIVPQFGPLTGLWRIRTLHEQRCRRFRSLAVTGPDCCLFQHQRRRELYRCTRSR